MTKNREQRAAIVDQVIRDRRTTKTFADSPLQRALLGASVYESDELRQRLKRFGRHWLRRMLAPD